jgi:hypothetical protein
MTDWLLTMNMYLRQAKWLKEQADNADGGQTDRSVAKFEPKNDEERKTYEELRELFEHFDADGSGELGKDEVTHTSPSFDDTHKPLLWCHTRCPETCYAKRGKGEACTL